MVLDDRGRGSEFDRGGGVMKIAPHAGCFATVVTALSNMGAIVDYIRGRLHNRRSGFAKFSFDIPCSWVYSGADNAAVYIYTRADTV